MAEIYQPGIEQEKELNSLIENGATDVNIPGTKRTYRLRWLKHEATRKITSILHNMKDGDDDKISCKAAAVIVLNDFWKIKFLYWLKWRWFYYVRQYTDNQLLPLIMEGKKKVPLEAFLRTTMLVIEMRDTIMTMKKEEVHHFLQGHHGDQPITRAKNTGG